MNRFDMKSAVRVLKGCVIACALVSFAGCSHLVVLHDPLTATEHNDLGVVYESTGRLDLAGKEYRKALKLDSKFSRARVNLGNIEAARGRWPKAESLYRRALRDSTTDYDAMNNLAIALLRQRRNLEEARTLAERAVGAGGDRDSLYRSTLEEVKAGPAR